MTPPCAPTSTPDRETASPAAVAAGTALPELPGINDRPTDPACPGTRHGSLRAYRSYGCCCPEVIAAVLAAAVQRNQHRRTRPASTRGQWEVDDGDVEAAVWAARHWRSMPAVTEAEMAVVVLRLHRIPSGGLDHMSADEIANRAGISDRTVTRYLEQDRLRRLAMAAVRAKRPMPGGLTQATTRAVVVDLARSGMAADEIVACTRVRQTLVDGWLKQEKLAAEQAASEAAQWAAEAEAVLTGYGVLTSV